MKRLNKHCAKGRENRRLVIEWRAAITPQSARQFYAVLKRHLKQADELVLLVDSTGGSVEFAYGLARFILKLKGPTTSYAIGQCSSAAVLLFSSARIRFATSAAHFYVHSVSKTLEGEQTIKMLQKTISELERYTKLTTSFLARQTKREASLWEKDMSRGRVISARGAQRLGLVQGFAEFKPQENDKRIIISS